MVWRGVVDLEGVKRDLVDGLAECLEAERAEGAVCKGMRDDRDAALLVDGRHGLSSSQARRNRLGQPQTDDMTAL